MPVTIAEAPPVVVAHTTTARVILHRTSGRDVKDRQLNVSLDGTHVASLLYGQTRTLEVEPGPHRLRVNNTLVWKTVDFESAPGAELHFTLVNRAPGYLLEMLAFVGVALLFVEVERGMPADTGPQTTGLG